MGASFFGSFWCSRCWLCMCERDSLWKIHRLAWPVWWCDKVRCSRPPTQNENAPKFGSRRSPPERKSTFKYCAGRIWVFLVLRVNRKNTVTVQVLLFVFQLKLRFRRLKNKSLSMYSVLFAPNCYHTSFTLETRHKDSNFVQVLQYV